MKRSEMENKLTNFILRVEGYSIPNGMTVGGWLLDYIEKAGMKPPYRPSDEKTIRCGISEWEPEDEE